MNNSKIEIKEMTKMAIFLALLCISSYIVIPLPFSISPLTLHTLIINTLVLILKPKYSILTITIYLLLGSLGLPIFSNGNGGFIYLFGPQGGFYFGFLISTIIMSFCLTSKSKTIQKALILFIGLIIQHFSGIIFFSIYTNTHLLSSFISMSFPFILGDITKIILSIIISNTIKKALKIQ